MTNDARPEGSIPRHPISKSLERALQSRRTSTTRGRSNRYGTKLRFNKRTALGRRLRDEIHKMEKIVPLDPKDPVVAQRIKHYALATLRLEELLAAAAEGEPIDDLSVVRLANLQTRLLDQLGLMKDDTRPSRSRR